MDLLKIFKKKKYSPEIEQIHNDFLFTQENKKEIIDVPEAMVKKSERLSKLGFNKSREISEIASIKKEADKIKLFEECENNYRILYPFNKFVSYEKIEQICKKYSLVYADISRYTGFVPEEKLTQIENFKLRDEDKDYFVCREQRTNEVFYIDNAQIMPSTVGGYYHFFKKGTSLMDSIRAPYAFQSNEPDKDDFYSTDSTNIFGLRYLGTIRFRVENTGYKICAPVKDIDTTGMRIEKGYLVKNIPDPVVLMPVKGGALIVAMWGDETFDPFLDEDLNNQKNN